MTVGGATFKPGADRGLSYLVDKEDREAVIASISAARRANDLAPFPSMRMKWRRQDRPRRLRNSCRRCFMRRSMQAPTSCCVPGRTCSEAWRSTRASRSSTALNSLFFIVGGAEAGTNAARRQQTGFYDSAVSVTEFKGGKPSVVRIYPITTIVDRPAAFGGSKIATGADAEADPRADPERVRSLRDRHQIENDVGDHSHSALGRLDWTRLVRESGGGNAADIFLPASPADQSFPAARHIFNDHSEPDGCADASMRRLGGCGTEKAGGDSCASVKNRHSSSWGPVSSSG